MARPGITRLGALRRVDPDAWRAEIEHALAMTSSATRAAEFLGVSPRTLRLMRSAMR